MPIEARNLPARHALTEEVPKNAKVRLRGAGRALFKTIILKTFISDFKLVLDLERISEEYDFILNDYFERYPQKIVIPSSFEVDYVEVVYPNAIHISLDEYKEKTVNVIPNIYLDPAPGYTLVGKPIIEPEKIKIAGSKNIVELINFVKTEADTFNNLTNDFSIDKNDVKTFFSGNEGFHLHVKSTSYQDLGSKERAELTDYIMFRGIIPETLGFKKFNPEKSSFPNYDDLGWRGRAAKQMYATKSKKSESVKQIISSGYTNFQKNLEEMKEQIGVKIDPNVTVDIHRIFRLAGSINSKSGLTKILVDDLEKFDPYVDACLFNDEEITLRANCPISFTLKNKNFGPYSNEITTVPRFAAIYMICKGVASLT